MFNQVMVAKQGWCILSYPGSLLARVFKAKYFPNKSFLEDEVGHSSLFTWMSFLWGHKDLQKGLRWRVGDGRTIQAFQDPWLPRLNSFKSITMSFGESSNLLVTELLSATPGEWNHEVISSNFWLVDASSIISISLKTSSSRGQTCVAF